MLLGNLLKTVNKNYRNIPIKGISFDSRKVKKKDIFFAIKGNQTSGIKFINDAISKGASVIVSTIKHVAMERPLLYYGVTGLCFLIVGLIFGGWTIQIYSETGSVTTNIALVGIGGVILGTILLITATILYSIANVVGGKK